MKLFSKIVITFFIVLVVLYYGTRWVMPSITIVNDSGFTIKQAKVTLPSNNLDFGEIASDQKNTLHYALQQANGEYRYHIEFSAAEIISGNCGYVTTNEINKRAVITINKNKGVECH